MSKYDEIGEWEGVALDGVHALFRILIFPFYLVCWPLGKLVQWLERWGSDAE